MSARFLFQTALLLLIGQVLLGGLGWFLVGVAPWAGLPVTLVLVWFLYRVGRIFREELRKAAAAGKVAAPGRLAFFVGLLAQLPGLALLPYWAPDWILSLWQGAVLPFTATLEGLWPAVGPAAGPWLWVAAPLEIGLFAWVAAGPERPVKAYSAAPAKAAVGEWSAARRLKDVKKKGLRVK